MFTSVVVSADRLCYLFSWCTTQYRKPQRPPKQLVAHYKPAVSVTAEGKNDNETTIENNEKKRLDNQAPCCFHADK